MFVDIARQLLNFATKRLINLRCQHNYWALYQNRRIFKAPHSPIIKTRASDVL